MDVRKLVKAGKHSHSVSLPKSWLEKHGLSSGDSVYLIQSENDITITPFPTAPTVKEKERTIEVGEKPITSVQRELTSAYINNCNVIHFTKVKEHDPILNALKGFIALEVVDQGESHIVAKDLLNLSEINVDQSLRRMDMILRTLFKDQEEREGDLNKLYFLLYRLLKGAMHDQKIADALELKQENLLLSWYLIVNLEDIGDILQNMTDKKALAMIEEQYLKAMKAYFTKDRVLAEQVLAARQGLADQAAKLPKASSEQARTLLTHVNNIARITLDLE